MLSIDPSYQFLVQWRYLEFISSISKTNNLLLKIVDYQNSPSGKNNDDLKFLGFVYDEDEER